MPTTQSLNLTTTITDHQSMDHTQSNPSHPNDEQGQIVQPHEQAKQSPTVSNIESILPTANANQLLDLIAQGHNPHDLHQLINQTNIAA